MEKRLQKNIAIIGFVVLTAMTTPGFAQDQPVAQTGQPVGSTGPTPVPQSETLAVPARVLSMDEAIAIAAANNPGLATARERVLRAQNVVRETKGLDNFTVGLTGNYSRFVPTSSTTVIGPNGQPQTVQIVPPSSTSAAATVTQPIDVSGRIRLGVGLAGLQLNIQEYGEAQTLQQLIFDTKTAYYGVLRAEANVDVARSSVRLAEERLRIATAQFTAGTAPRFDVDRAQVDVTNFTQTLIQALNAVDVAKATLSRTVGINANDPIEVQNQVVTVTPVTFDIPSLTNQALVARPEVQQAVTGVRFAQKNVKFVSTEDQPQLAAFATSNYSSTVTSSGAAAGGSSFGPKNLRYTYGLSVNWPIWTGGVTRARVAEARNDVNIARDTLTQAQLGVELDVRTGALNVMEASRRVGSSQANVTLAEEALRLATVRYQEGVATQVEVIDAQNALIQAQTNYVSAQYDYLRASAQLQRAVANQPEYTALTSSAPAAVTPQGVSK